MWIISSIAMTTAAIMVTIHQNQIDAMREINDPQVGILRGEASDKLILKWKETFPNPEEEIGPGYSANLAGSRFKGMRLGTRRNNDRHRDAIPPYRLNHLFHRRDRDRDLEYTIRRDGIIPDASRREGCDKDEQENQEYSPHH